jgi:hypothetical protein
MDRNLEGKSVTTPPDAEDYDGHKIRMLFDALTAMRGREAKDPRDNIYAFKLNLSLGGSSLADKHLSNQLFYVCYRSREEIWLHDAGGTTWGCLILCGLVTAVARGVRMANMGT